MIPALTLVGVLLGSLLGAWLAAHDRPRFVCRIVDWLVDRSNGA